MTRVLVLNSGSSSIKYRLFDGEKELAKGLIERIGEDGGGAQDHQAALQQIMDSVDLDGLAAVGHRVVHGGTRFTAGVRLTDDVLGGIRDLTPLAPLHQPPAIAAKCEGRDPAGVGC